MEPLRFTFHHITSNLFIYQLTLVSGPAWLSQLVQLGSVGFGFGIFIVVLICAALTWILFKG